MDFEVTAAVAAYPPNLHVQIVESNLMYSCGGSDLRGGT